MDNKLSELSKPVAWTDSDAVDILKAGKWAPVFPEKYQDSFPLYSQEYVSALLAELGASKKSNAFLKEQLAKLANFNPDWDMLEACRESWREVAAALKEAEANLEAKDKTLELELEKSRRVMSENHQQAERIAELEAKTAMTMGVGDGGGSLFVHGDYDSIKAAQHIVFENESLRAKLATPVRLQSPWVDKVGNRWLLEGTTADVIRAAGFAVTVEGGE